MESNSLLSILESPIKMTLAYDGRNYLGWQRTKEGPSIEQTLENALFQIFQQPIKLKAASRTDAGVHADGQVVACWLPKLKDPIKLKNSLNALLPDDIAILKLKNTSPDFDPTNLSIAKEYHYFLCTADVTPPKLRATHWQCKAPIDLSKIEQAAAVLIGTHDFKAFSNFKKNDPTTNHICTINDILPLKINDLSVSIRIVGNRFLYKMVRNIVGTLVEAGKGMIHPMQVVEILKSRNRRLAGPTAPANGLTLHKVYYENTKS